MLVDATLYATTEDEIATCETREEGVVGLLFARERRSAEQYHSRLVGHGKLSKVAGVGTGGFENEAEFITKAEKRSELVLHAWVRGTYGPERKRKTMLGVLLV